MPNSDRKHPEAVRVAEGAGELLPGQTRSSDTISDAGSPTPPAHVPIEDRHDLSGQQRHLVRALHERDRMLARIFGGGLMVFYDRNNTDRFALHAHAMREVMVKLSEVLDVPIKDLQVSLKGKVNELQTQWESARRGSNATLADIDSAQTLDSRARKFLRRIERFFDWFAKNHPSRRSVFGKILDRLGRS